ncbi:U6 snRNA phosphodiesterase Usb1 [Aspergillus carlsbadensis]|nr:U6 snRNA phosphodiesterase Usb1 [Aspergillus carlsbadensis]
MALVQYSDSESDFEQETPPRKINKLDEDTQSRNSPNTLPPLPAAFHDLYASSIRISVRDDPSLHGGRKRVIPHVEGNWPTHIYLEWYPSKDELGILRDVIIRAEKMLQGGGSKLHSLLHSDLGAQLPLHVSLSRPVVLRTEQRQPFLDTFERTLETSDISPFDIQIGSLDWVSNSEKTRWFYVLRVKRPDQDYLNQLLQISNGSLGVFGQPPLYESTLELEAETPKDYTEYFHVSVAWSLQEPSVKGRDNMDSIALQRLVTLKIQFDSVKAKIGNYVSSIPLARPSLH